MKRVALFSTILLVSSLVSATEVYFSPNGHCREEVIRRIHQARSAIDIAMYSLTADEIAQALADAKRRGVRVRIIRDLSQSAEKSDQDIFLESQGIEIHILKGIGRGIMHDKFAIFDGREGFTGSYNWTNNAEFDNHENALFFEDPNLLKAYAGEFARLWQEPEAPGARHASNGPTETVQGLVLHRHPILSAVTVLLVIAALFAALST